MSVNSDLMKKEKERREQLDEEMKRGACLRCLYKVCACLKPKKKVVDIATESKLHGFRSS